VANGASVFAWADSQLTGWDEGFGDDCTDYVSRSLLYGGHFVMTRKSNYYLLPEALNDPTQWYLTLIDGYKKWTWSWTVARASAEWLYDQGSSVLPYTSMAKKGDIIYVNWTENDWSNINHAAVVDYATKTNVYLDQHSHDRQEPIYKVGSDPNYWYAHVDPVSGKQDGGSANMKVWILVPQEKL
jgi:Putative amidase domain